MAVMLNNQQLLSLLKQLKKLPMTWKICGEAEAKLEGIVPDFDFFVDRWSDWTTVVARSVQPGYHFGVYEMSARDIMALSVLLQHPGIIDWTNRIEFLCVTSEILAVVLQLIETKGRSYYIDDKCVCLRVTQDTLILRDLTEGFKLTHLHPDQSKLVNSAWKFYRGEESDRYIKHLIRHYPSCCLCNEEGHAVGFCISYHYGALGMLHVLEGHRGKGLSRIILSHLAKECLQAGRDVCVFIEESNTSSLRIHEDVGFKIIPDFLGMWVHVK